MYGSCYYTPVVSVHQKRGVIMSKRTADEIVQMFVDRKNPEFGPTPGCAWSQRNGSEAAHIWITRKQCSWVQSVAHDDQPNGVIITGGLETRWQLIQTSRRSNNGAGLIKLAR